jgi:ATP-dependent DNA ligase
MAFDVLYSDDRDLTQDALRERRLRLEDVVAGSDRVFPVRRLADTAWTRGRRSSTTGMRVTSSKIC